MAEEKYIVDDLIEKEKVRNRSMRDAYEQKLMQYPKGTLTLRTISGRKYFYFRYRDGKKVITKYAGTEAQAEELKQLVEERSKIVEMINMLDAEYEKIIKIENVK